MPELELSAAGRPQKNSADTLRAPLFTTLVSQLRGDKRAVILDLGAPRAGTIAFCSRFPCRLDIADLAPDIEALNSEQDSAELARLAEAVLPEARKESADVVLCWDLLNYLRRPALTALMQRVAARSHTGTLVHFLIVYSNSSMPARPGAFSPVFSADSQADEDLRLVNVPATDEECTAPGYTPETLGRCLRGYRMERAMLLSNGMQEFLFRV